MSDELPDDGGEADEDYEAFDEEDPGQAVELGGSHVFKVLCPANLANAVVGTNGDNQRSIEEDTGARLHLSAEDEVFPRSNCQILAISAAESSQVLAALDRVIEALIEAGEVELGGRRLADADSCVGRDAGEFIFRACLPGQATGKIIGPRGAYIEAMRKETGAKVFVENDKHNNHQMLRIIGVVDAITTALPQVLDSIDTEMADEEQRKNWCLSTPYQPADDGASGGADSAGPVVVPPPRKVNTRRRRGGKGRNAKEPVEDTKGGGSQGSKGGWKSEEAPGTSFTLTPRQPPKKGGKGGKGGDSSVSHGESWEGQEPVEAMRQLRQQFPDGAVDMQHGIACDLPSERVKQIFTREGDFSGYVEKATGAKVWVEEVPKNATWEEAEYRKLHVQGPLMSCYLAHLLVMKRYHELDRQEKSNQAMQSLQAQVEQLQKQLEEAKQTYITPPKTREASAGPPAKARKVIPAVVAPPRPRGGSSAAVGHPNGRK